MLESEFLHGEYVLKNNEICLRCSDFGIDINHLESKIEKIKGGIPKIYGDYLIAGSFILANVRKNTSWQAKDVDIFVKNMPCTLEEINCTVTFNSMRMIEYVYQDTPYQLIKVNNTDPNYVLSSFDTSICMFGYSIRTNKLYVPHRTLLDLVNFRMTYIAGDLKNNWRNLARVKKYFDRGYYPILKNNETGEIIVPKNISETINWNIHIKYQIRSDYSKK